MGQEVLALGEEREGVDVARIEDVTPVEPSVRTAVVLWIVWIGEPIEIVAHLGDIVRPGVGKLRREPMPIFQADTGLERVVVEVGLVLLLLDAAEPGIVTVAI